LEETQFLFVAQQTPRHIINNSLMTDKMTS